MILIGIKDVEKIKNVGNFYCPSCCRSKIYHDKLVYEYLTVYLLPIFRIKCVGEYIECNHCHNTFGAEIIERQKNGIDRDVESEFKKITKRIIMLTILSDGKVKPVEIREAEELYYEVTGEKLSKMQIISEKEKAINEKLSLEEYLRTSRYLLNESGKEAVILVACGIATCDGEFHNKEMAFIKRCSNALGITEKHLFGILEKSGSYGKFVVDS